MLYVMLDVEERGLLVGSVLRPSRNVRTFGGDSAACTSKSSSVGDGTVSVRFVNSTVTLYRI